MTDAPKITATEALYLTKLLAWCAETLEADAATPPEPAPEQAPARKRSPLTPSE